MRTTLQRQVPHRQLEDRSGVEGEAEEVAQEAVQIGSEEVEAEEVNEHFLDKRTRVEFCIIIFILSPIKYLVYNKHLFSHPSLVYP